jgi:hypothetical protein
MPMANTRPTSRTLLGSSGTTAAASPNDSTSCERVTAVSSRRRSTMSTSRPPTIDSASIGPSWANTMTPTNVDDPVRS